MSTAADIRLIVAFPLMGAVGLAFAFFFWVRWKQSSCRGDFWASVLGASNALLGLTGLLAGWLRKVSIAQWGEFAGWAYTIGTVGVAVVLVAGLASLIASGWQNGGRH